MIGDVGWQELLIILVIIALLFGAQRVGDMGKALGRGVKEFRESAKGDEPAAPAAPPAASTTSTATSAAPHDGDAPKPTA